MEEDSATEGISGKEAKSIWRGHRAFPLGNNDKTDKETKRQEESFQRWRCAITWERYGALVNLARGEGAGEEKASKVFDELPG